MQMGLTLPVQNMNICSTRSSAFNCTESCTLNARSRNVNVSCSSVKSMSATKMTRKHLSSLEKLLQIQSEPNELVEVDQDVNTVKSHSENKRRGVLEGLNLSNIWPESKAADEVSPRQLVRLKRMLSKSGERSPRNNLGTKWREYHGCNNWAGLLDPLDENLRREMVRYGEFIQAAYHCFHTSPDTSADNASLDRHVALPDKAFKVTKNLYATSSVGLPTWVDNVAPGLGWMTQRSSCVGYVAVCQDQKEIARMGRRDIVIALRGTATCLEWAENMRDMLVEMPGHKGESNGTTAQAINPKVECGFLSLYKTASAQMPSLSESIVREIQRLVELYKDETLSITVTGHSLGAAMALLVADELSSSVTNVPPIAVFSFGGPRVGNRGFAHRLNSKNVKVLRIVNSQDVITRVPGMFVSENLDKKLRESEAATNVLNMLDNMPWAYSHVGTELRVETKMSPFLKPDADVACCHDLEAYLHLVDGFLASDSPFRSNAKRSLVKLLDEQNSNVKKLYTNKAKALTLKLNPPQREILQMSSCLPSPSS